MDVRTGGSRWGPQLACALERCMRSRCLLEHHTCHRFVRLGARLAWPGNDFARAAVGTRCTRGGRTKPTARVDRRLEQAKASGQRDGMQDARGLDPHLEPTESRNEHSTFAATGALGLVLIVTPSCAHNVPAAGAGAANISSRPTSERAASHGDAIRPFRVDVPEEAVVDMRRALRRRGGPIGRRSPINPRACVSRSSSRSSQYWGDGLRLAQGRGEAECVAAVHDRDRRARHSVRPRPSRHPNAMPLIMTHGWPGSIFEL